MTEAADPQRIDSRGGFVTAVQRTLDAALRERTRCMTWVDADFADWPLDDAAMLQPLAQWLRLPQRRLRMILCHGESLRPRPRFMPFYSLWAHAIEVLSPCADDEPALPCLMLAEGTALVQVHDKLRWRGGCRSDRAALHACKEQIDALAQRSMPSLPVTTLGL